MPGVSDKWPSNHVSDLWATKTNEKNKSLEHVLPSHIDSQAINLNMNCLNVVYHTVTPTPLRRCRCMVLPVCQQRHCHKKLLNQLTCQYHRHHRHHPQCVGVVRLGKKQAAAAASKSSKFVSSLRLMINLVHAISPQYVHSALSYSLCLQCLGRCRFHLSARPPPPPPFYLNYVIQYTQNIDTCVDIYRLVGYRLLHNPT